MKRTVDQWIEFWRAIWPSHAKMKQRIHVPERTDMMAHFAEAVRFEALYDAEKIARQMLCQNLDLDDLIDELQRVRREEKKK